MSGVKIECKHLIELKSAIESEFLARYKDNLDAIHNIESKTKLQDSAPLIELSKLSQLLRSHSTKLGIILKPETFTEKNYEATYKELKSIIDTTFYLFSLLPLFQNKEYTQLLLSQLDASMLKFLNSLQSLCKELDSKFNNKEYDEERLMCIGMIWSCCDDWDSISKLGNLGILAESIKLSSQLIRDVMDEVEDFLEDPEANIGQRLDFLDDDFDSEDDEDKDDQVTVDKNHEDSESKSLEDIVALVLPIMKEWKIKVVLLRTLFNSFRNVIMSKDPPKIYTIEMLDDLDNLHKSIAGSADNFTCTIYMADETFTKDDITEETDEINKDVRQMLSIIKKIKKKASDKNEFANVWETKFFEASSL
ncbi:hypothetical protein MOUN0_O08944 [Monosporozyma unispora]|nr:hypothetical protein C6P44_003499 [Kazachstania unispora]